MGDQVISPNKLTDAYHLLESYSHTVCATTGSAAHGGIYPPASVSSYLINNSCVVDTRRRETNRHSVNRVVHRMRMLCSISSSFSDEEIDRRREFFWGNVATFEGSA